MIRKRDAALMLIRRKMNWPDFPFVVVQADICREDLLVEIEGTAVLSLS